jgi:hypothetical protein
VEALRRPARGPARRVSLAFAEEDAVGLYGIGTVPAARRRGVGAAATLAPMLDARAAGASHAILHSTDQCLALYSELGFVELCTVTRFGWLP